MIELQSIYRPNARPSVSPAVMNFLYDLLAERDEITNISHCRMPSRADHVKFVLDRPYKDWQIIVADGERIGATYLSKNNEIGIFILKEHRGKGYGREVIRNLQNLHDEFTLLANINPRNKPSIDLFLGEGFEHIQNTYRWKRPKSD